MHVRLFRILVNERESLIVMGLHGETFLANLQHGELRIGRQAVIQAFVISRVRRPINSDA